MRSDSPHAFAAMGPSAAQITAPHPWDEPHGLTSPVGRVYRLNGHIFQSRNAFKIPSLWGVARTAPYFHDNSAKTLEDVTRHYARFFALISPIVLTEQDQSNMVAYMRLLR